MPTTYSVVELPPTGGINEKGERHYTRSFHVVSSNPLDGPAQIARGVDYSLYEGYPFPGERDEDAILKKVDVRATETLVMWELSLEYDSATNAIDRGATQPSASGGGEPKPAATPSSPGQGSQEKPPDGRPWVIKWGAIKTTKLLTKDYSSFRPRRAPGARLERVLPGAVERPGRELGKPVVNSAGVPFDPPIEVPCSHTTVSITAFSSVADPTNIGRYLDKVNRTRFMGAAAGCARCTNYSITSQYEQGAFSWQIDVEVEFNEDGWSPIRVVDAGVMERVLVNPPGVIIPPGQDQFRLQPILDRTGQPITHPVPLNGMGGQLLVQIGGVPNDLVYLEFQGYLIADFRKLLFQGRRRRGT